MEQLTQLNLLPLKLFFYMINNVKNLTLKLLTKVSTQYINIHILITFFGILNFSGKFLKVFL